MKIIWTPEGAGDIIRLHAFLAAVDGDAAVKTVQMLQLAPEKLTTFPRIGERFQTLMPREVRKLSVGKYEMRYEIIGNEIHILKIFHGREDRSFEEVSVP